MNIDLERKFIIDFIPKIKQERILGLLTNKKKRDKFRSLLFHSIVFDEKYVLGISKEKQNLDDMYNLLKEKEHSEIYYVISVNNKIDGLELSLKEALDKVLGKLLGGTIIISVSSSLAYYEGEEYSDRCILYR